LGWVAGALVGVVLLIAGAAKLTSRQWPAQADLLGVPRAAVKGIPVLELGIGVGLVAGVPYAGVAAIVLLAAFTVFLAAALVRGVEAPCACFGSLSTRPVSWWSVARNVALIGLAVVSLG
jgi:Methylamine utilisation protein MauE